MYIMYINAPSAPNDIYLNYQKTSNKPNATNVPNNILRNPTLC